jgi:hypothetical protein
VYVPVPPDATTVALPLQTALQVTFTCDCVAVITGGCVIVAVAVAVHPFASVTVTVYEPAMSVFAVAPVPPDGAHAYVYGAVPPATVTVAEPLLPPKQVTFVEAEMLAVGPPELGTFAIAVVVHPRESVTVTVYEPASNPDAVVPVPPEGAHEYV